MLFQIRVGALSFEWGMLRTQHQWTWLHGSVLACKTTIPESGEGSSSRLKVLFSCHIMGGSMALQPRQQGRKHLINVPRSERQTSRAVPSHSGGTPKHRQKPSGTSNSWEEQDREEGIWRVAWMEGMEGQLPSAKPECRLDAKWPPSQDVKGLMPTVCSYSNNSLHLNSAPKCLWMYVCERERG